MNAIYTVDGYAVIDNFLPDHIATELYTMYSSEIVWEQQDQVREKHYSHVFKMHHESLPQEGEHYIAKFGRSFNIEKSIRFKEIYKQYVLEALSTASAKNLTTADTRCYQLIAGDLYRTHIDAYAADVGLVYYINKTWRWDWGGILHITQDNDNTCNNLTSILPKFNRAVVLNHGIFRFPHFVSSVESFAKEPRYSIVSFNR